MQAQPKLSERFREVARANGCIQEVFGRELAEIRQGYRGIAHSVALCHGEYVEQYERIKEVEAAIGALQEQVAGLEESISKAREAYRKLRDKKEEQ